jgi:signal transduction histidine kinase
MTLYPVIPLLACLVSAILATAILVRAHQRTANRLAAAVMICASFWAFCEVMWHGQSDPNAALALVKLASLGWLWIGPFQLQLFLEVSTRPWLRVRRAARWSFALAGVFVLIDWFTPWLHTGVVRQPWGWAYEVGPAFPLVVSFTVACIGTGVWVGLNALARANGGERRLLRLTTWAMLLPLFVASATDALLPIFGVQVPRFATASFTVFGAVILWAFRSGESSLLAPATFAEDVFAALPVGVAMLRPNGTVRVANAALGRLCGVDASQLLGWKLPDALSTPLVTASGDEEYEAGLTAPDGESRPVAVACKELRDAVGTLIGRVVVVRDLREVAGLRDRLLLSGRLAAVGELAAGVAHEINNPLAFVRANLSLMRRDWGALVAECEKVGIGPAGRELLAEGEELIDESLEGVDRAGAIVRDVKGLAHGGGRARQQLDLNPLLQGALRLAAPQLRGRVQVETRLNALPPVLGAPQELHQVFLNLLLNASHAIEGRGTIGIETRHEGEWATVEVIDDGCGIAPEIRERIFDPFFTTKDVGEGTGLGLGIAYNIVRSHGGEIDVISEPGADTRFRVRLPAVADTLDPA